MEKKRWGQFMENFAFYGIWAGFTSNKEPLTLDEQERDVFKNYCCNELPLIEEQMNRAYSNNLGHST